MEGVFAWIKNITYYLLFVSLLTYLMPSGKYEQYIRLFFGAVFILLVIRPLTGGLHIDGSLAQDYKRIRFTQEQEEFQKKLWGMEEERMHQIMEQYEAAVGQDIRAMADEEGFYCISAKARIEDQEGKENFGQVVEIAMVIGQGGEDGEADGKEGAEADEKANRRRGTEGDGSGEDLGKGRAEKDDRQEGKTVSIDPVKVVIGQEDPEAWGLEWKEGEGGEENLQEGKAEENEGRQKTQEAIEKFQRRVARYYGLEEEAVRITWKDD